MAIVRWDPIKDLMTIQDRMNKVFDEAFTRQNGQNYGDWTPPVDIFETTDQIVIMAEVPGVPESDLDIQVSEGVLTIKGDKPMPTDKESDSFYRLERAYGKFSRAFAIPNSVDVNTVKASLKDGLLRVTLDKRGEIQPKIIKVTKE